MIGLSARASAQVDALERYYIDKERPQAVLNLGHALAEAMLIVMNAPERGLPAPRPYPDVARMGLLWIKRGPYWIGYDPSVPVIAAVFYETSDIPSQLG